VLKLEILKFVVNLSSLKLVWKKKQT